MLTDSPLARIHYTLRADHASDRRLPTLVDLPALEAQVAQACKRWVDGVHAALLAQGGESTTVAALVQAFPTAYREKLRCHHRRPRCAGAGPAGATAAPWP